MFRQVQHDNNLNKMFTGIIETLGEVKYIVKEGSNIHFTIMQTLVTLQYRLTQIDVFQVKS